ncbi:hypothetical protein RvY_18966 [Ramazzottius varieornatus]|uniref:Uncharacterized protein n=1 Tax=Ramazzottius varieornatus TaxID=947166 RepID=A0A1D1WBY3_RAMVA|nr:hypothetical protein RvY_18966 [Ramazzottius varieornatus]
MNEAYKTAQILKTKASCAVILITWTYLPAVHMNCGPEDFEFPCEEECHDERAGPLKRDQELLNGPGTIKRRRKNTHKHFSVEMQHTLDSPASARSSIGLGR